MLLMATVLVLYLMTPVVQTAEAAPSVAQWHLQKAFRSVWSSRKLYEDDGNGDDDDDDYDDDDDEDDDDDDYDPNCEDERGEKIVNNTSQKKCKKVKVSFLFILLEYVVPAVGIGCVAYFIYRRRQENERIRTLRMQQQTGTNNGNLYGNNVVIMPRNQVAPQIMVNQMGSQAPVRFNQPQQPPSVPMVPMVSQQQPVMAQGTIISQYSQPIQPSTQIIAQGTVISQPMSSTPVSGVAMPIGRPRNQPGF